MLIESIFETNRCRQIVLFVKNKYENNGDPGHDWNHILRVVGNCLKLAKDTSADLETLIPAALLHDVINVPKNHPDRLIASQKAASEADGILRLAGFSAEEISRIQVVITEHSYSLGKKPTCIESAILQDADRLDALGAIGIMRMTTCGAKMGSKYYCTEEPFVKSRELDDKKFTMDHLYVKLFKLVEGFNTPQAKQEGLARAQFMEKFVDQLKAEI